MSKHLYVHHQDRGFWVYDVALGILLKFLIDEALARPAEEDRGWLDAEIAHWRVHAVISDFGLPIPDVWSDHQRDVTSRTVCQRLAARGTVTAEEAEAWAILDGTGVWTRGEPTVDVAPLVALGEALIALLEGTLPPPPEGTSWIYGSPGGRLLVPRWRSSG
jgi:mannose-6-phosphate isomerase-like protein (cupin superfamily)